VSLAGRGALVDRALEESLLEGSGLRAGALAVALDPGGAPQQTIVQTLERGIALGVLRALHLLDAAVARHARKAAIGRAHASHTGVHSAGARAVHAHARAALSADTAARALAQARRRRTVLAHAVDAGLRAALPARLAPRPVRLALPAVAADVVVAGAVAALPAFHALQPVGLALRLRLA